MGNGQSDSKDIHSMEELYKVIKRSSDGLNMLQERATGKQYLLRQMTSNLENEFQRIHMAVQKRRNQYNQHLLAIRQTYTRTQNNLSSNQFKLFLMVEYPFRNLYEEAEERRVQNNPFSQDELWSILYSCCLGLKHIYSYQGRHQGLSSDRVYIDRDGLVKVGDPFLLGHQANYDYRPIHITDHHIYLSPQQIDMLSNPKYSYNPEASDVFTLGLIITEISSFAYLDEIYQQGHTRINRDRLKRRLDEVAMKYGYKLRSVLDKMTRLDSRERTTLTNVIQAIQNEAFDDEESISSSMPFSRSNVTTDKPNSVNGIVQQQVHMYTNGKGNNNAKRPDEVKPTHISNFNQNPLIISANEVKPEKNWDRQTMERLPINPPYNASQNLSNSNFDYQMPSTNMVYNGQVPYGVKFDSSRSSPGGMAGMNYSAGNTSSYTSGSTNYYPSFQPPTTFPMANNSLASSYSSSYMPGGYPSATATLGTNNLGVNPSWNVKSSLQPTYQVTTPPTNSYLPQLSSDPYTSNPNKPYPDVTPQYSSFNTAAMPPKSPVDIFSQSMSNIPQSNKGQDNTAINSTLKDNRMSPSVQKSSLQMRSMSPVQQLQTPERKQRPNMNLNVPIINNNPSSSGSQSLSSNSAGGSAYQQTAQMLPNSTIAEVTENEFSGSSQDSLKYEILEYEQGSRYQGYTLHGMRHGFGKFYYQDGGHYEGEWKDNKMNGFAKLYYQNNDLAYEGFWKDDQFHGKGKVYNDNPRKIEGPFDYVNLSALDECWIYYQGEFDEDSKHGFGTVKLSNGETFEGEFQRDVINGEGRFYRMNGEIIHGIWQQNKLVKRLQ